MTESQFVSQMGRLERQFGKFGPERGSILWREVKDFSEPWFSKVIDKFIGECRQAPLLPDFREEIAKERERLWSLEKITNEQDAKEFWAGSAIQDEERKHICQTITKRLKGKISDQDWHNFKKGLQGLEKTKASA